MNWEAFGNFEDILYHKGDGVAKVTINRPHKRNAFRPKTVSEMYEAFLDAREDPNVGVVLLTGAGPHTDGKYAFCSGGDQSVRGDAGYVDDGGVPRLNVLDLQKLIRSMPKVVIALVAGYAIGGGHVLRLWAVHGPFGEHVAQRKRHVRCRRRQKGRPCKRELLCRGETDAADDRDERDPHRAGRGLP